jgi:hypothetical protein
LHLSPFIFDSDFPAHTIPVFLAPQPGSLRSYTSGQLQVKEWPKPARNRRRLVENSGNSELRLSNKLEYANGENEDSAWRLLLLHWLSAFTRQSSRSPIHTVAGLNADGLRHSTSRLFARSRVVTSGNLKLLKLNYAGLHPNRFGSFLSIPPTLKGIFKRTIFF